MIFKSKKAFNEEIDKRMNEIQFKTSVNEDLWKLKDRMSELEFKVRCLEDKGCNCETPASDVPVKGAYSG